jgi:hypothetical protein
MREPGLIEGPMNWPRHGGGPAFETVYAFRVRRRALDNRFSAA